MLEEINKYLVYLRTKQNELDTEISNIKKKEDFVEKSNTYYWFLMGQEEMLLPVIITLLEMKLKYTDFKNFKNKEYKDKDFEVIGKKIEFKEHQNINLLEEFTSDIDLDNPKFYKAEKIHDWRNYVPYDWQKNWNKFTKREKQIIIVMMKTQADKEELE